MRTHKCIPVGGKNFAPRFNSVRARFFNALTFGFIPLFKRLRLATLESFGEASKINYRPRPKALPSHILYGRICYAS